MTFKDGDAGTDTRAVLPLKTSAPPYLPAVVHVAPLSVPVLLLPEASRTVVPIPASKLYAATGPEAWAATGCAVAKVSAKTASEIAGARRSKNDVRELRIWNVGVV